jgi:hypothetical protein
MGGLPPIVALWLRAGEMLFEMRLSQMLHHETVSVPNGAGGSRQVKIPTTTSQRITYQTINDKSAASHTYAGVRGLPRWLMSVECRLNGLYTTQLANERSNWHIVARGKLDVQRLFIVTCQNDCHFHFVCMPGHRDHSSILSPFASDQSAQWGQSSEDPLASTMLMIVDCKTIMSDSVVSQPRDKFGDKITCLLECLAR